MIKRFIVWYLKRFNTEFYYKGYVVKIFTKNYYNKVIQNHNAMEKRVYNPSKSIKISQ